MAEHRETTAQNDDVSLAGSIWMPIATRPRAGVVMHPGSGASNRHNGRYFPPLRTALVSAGYAVASFDKRGVGGSTGTWQEASIETQARDMLAGVARLAAEPEMVDVPVGLFGHGQGALVAMEAAAREPEIPFAILNSGSGVTPADQERYAARRKLEGSRLRQEEIERSIARYDLMVRLARALTPYDEIANRREELAPHLPKNESVWRFWISILDYSPKSALSRIHAPILGLWGEDDPVVPVEESVEIFRSNVPPNRLSLEVFAGGDHWIRVGDPPVLAPGYVDKVLSFLEWNSQS